MQTSPDSSPIGAHTEYPEHHPSLQSKKSTPKIDKAVMKIKAANTDSTKTIGPQVVFLHDSTLNTAENIEKHKAELLAIEIDCDRIQREQANIITITRKPILPENKLGTLNSLTEPNKEVQMNFAGPILFKNNSLNNYILVTVDRLSRLPHAETYNNSPTPTTSTLHPTGSTIQIGDSDSDNSENIPLV